MPFRYELGLDILTKWFEVPVVACKWIEKIGLAAVDNGRLLVVRKKGSSVFILPGGKPEGDETDLEALTRELDEELGCRVRYPNLVGVFKDVAADHTNAVVIVRLYSGNLDGDPEPQSEIEEQAWLDLRHPKSMPLAPSIVNLIVPHLRKQIKKGAFEEGGSVSKAGDQTEKGLFEFI